MLDVRIEKPIRVHRNCLVQFVDSSSLDGEGRWRLARPHKQEHSLRRKRECYLCSLVEKALLDRMPSLRIIAVKDRIVGGDEDPTGSSLARLSLFMTPGYCEHCCMRPARMPCSLRIRT